MPKNVTTTVQKRTLLLENYFILTIFTIVFNTQATEQQVLTKRQSPYANIWHIYCYI